MVLQNRESLLSIPEFSKDTTDRNRTSPFAFTGNKFEFRMLGSNESIACANVFLNTVVAEELSQFADTLEKAKDFKATLHELILKTIKEHKRIIFNGNGYDDSWVKEAEKRGLYNLKSTPEALPHREFQAANPDADVIKLSIGDVTRPICPAVIDAMHKAVDEMADEKTFRGYPPEQGYDFVRQKILEYDYLARGIKMQLDEIFLSDGAKSDWYCRLR